MQPIHLTHEASRPRLNVMGEVIEVLADAGTTGSYEIFEQHGPEGTGSPPHSHSWDEAYYVLEGELDVQLGERMVVVRKGDFVHVPGGTPHFFRYRKGGGRFLSVSSSGRVSAFFADLDREVPPGPPDLSKVVAIAGRHELQLAGPPPA